MVTAIDCRGVPSKMVRLGLTQIDLIIQIYYFLCGFCDFCESLFHIAAGAGLIRYAPTGPPHPAMRRLPWG